MLTTTQVRAIMHKHKSVHATWDPIWTNKTAGHTGADRRVKTYYSGNKKLLKALQTAAGKGNVKLTAGGNWYGAMGPGIVVKCVLG